MADSSSSCITKIAINWMPLEMELLMMLVRYSFLPLMNYMIPLTKWVLIE